MGAVSIEALRADLLKLRKAWLERARFYGVVVNIAKKKRDEDIASSVSMVVETLEQSADELMRVIRRHSD